MNSEIVNNCYGGKIVPPSPGGEGRGEGERLNHSPEGERPNHLGTVSPEGERSNAPRHWLRPIRVEDVTPLVAMATADGHSVIAPSHILEKRGEMVGYSSFGTVPLVIMWFDTKRCQPADSFYYINQLELLMTNALPPGHHGVVCVPFGPPFQPLMPALGYQDGGKMNFGFKKFRG